MYLVYSLDLIGSYLLNISVAGWSLLMGCLRRSRQSLPLMEESPGSMEKRCRVTLGGGDPRESATESKPPVHVICMWVRVKGCGKSAPHGR
jgi:hypothetical protein